MRRGLSLCCSTFEKNILKTFFSRAAASMVRNAFGMRKKEPFKCIPCKMKGSGGKNGRRSLPIADLLEICLPAGICSAVYHAYSRRVITSVFFIIQLFLVVMRNVGRFAGFCTIILLMTSIIIVIHIKWSSHHFRSFR